MKVIGLDDKEYVWNLAKYVGNERRGCSEYHKRARALLKEIFPFEQILEEVGLPGSSLFADFYIHNKRLMIEVQGEQHTKHIPFFHKDKLTFGKAKMRDKAKKNWCENNGITLLELSYNDEDKWKEKICQI